MSTHNEKNISVRDLTAPDVATKPEWYTVSKERHAQRSWYAPVRHDFARSMSLLPITAADMPQAVASVPIAFVRQGEGVGPALLLGLNPHKNLFVSAEGRWALPFIPHQIACFPFRLIRDTAKSDRSMVLCVDEQSGLVREDLSGQRFFSDEGEIAPELQRIVQDLEKAHIYRQRSLEACQVLDDLELLEPWQVVIQKPGDQVERLDGLLRINETRLRELRGESLERLHAVDGLGIAYCHLLSLRNLRVLVSLSGMQTYLNQQKEKDEQAILGVKSDTETLLNWDNV